jgi:hypothetical protein
VAREVTFAGEGGRITIAVVRYEFREDAAGSEANWLRGGVRVELSATGAFRCSVPVLYMADELAYFRDDLGRILARQKGVATLETEEDCVSLAVAIAPRLPGHCHGRGVAAKLTRSAGGPGARVPAARADDLADPVARLDVLVGTQEDDALLVVDGAHHEHL